MKASDNPVLKVRDALVSRHLVRAVPSRSRRWAISNAGDWVMRREFQRCEPVCALSMYNHLNTTFDKNSATTYSSSNAVSSATRDAHNSVNLVGSAGVSWLYWVNGARLCCASSCSVWVTRSRW